MSWQFLNIFKHGTVNNDSKPLFSGILIELGIDGKIKHLSQQGKEFFGLEDADLKKGISIKDMFPEYYIGMRKNLGYIAKPDDIISDEHTIENFEGEKFTLLSHAIGVFSGKNLTHYRIIVSDISGQRETENQIIKEKALFEGMFNYSPEATALIDTSGTVIRVNFEFTKLFGFAADEAMDKNISSLVFPSENRMDSIGADQFYSDEPRVEKEVVLKDKSGRLLNINLSSAAITVGGKAISHILSFRNISNERKLYLLQEAVYNISSLALDLPSLSNIYPVICNELNRVWRSKKFFIALKSADGKNLTLPSFMDEMDKFETVPIKKTLTGWLINNKMTAILKKNDIQKLEKEGLVDQVGTDCAVWMGASIVIRDQVLGAVCIQDYHDENRFSEEDLELLDYAAKHIAIAIDRRMLMDSMIEAKKMAEEAANNKQLFLSTMSHEIRTPLNEVIGIANILLQENLREDHIDYVKSLLFSSNHLLTLVNDILDFNKIDAGKTNFEHIPFSLKNYLEELGKVCVIRTKAKNLSFELIKENAIPEYVVGDQVRLNQVISNLFSNSLKFTREGGIKIIVGERQKYENKSRIEFRIEDTGIGIQEDKIDSIFDTFSQASKSTNRQYGGSGLGLTISKRIIELLGGTLKVDSTYGKGSSFYFELEFRLPSNMENGQKAIIENPELISGKRVLIAEDNKINFMVANKMLSARGLVISHAENGKKAVEMVEKDNFDLVLMDLHMPEMDGIEATRTIRNSSNTKINDIPIVALTAVTLSDCKDRIADIRFDGYILKPFKPESLFGTITRLLS
ncbi:MAG TPA: response regulator [Bacteroidetes bacterium]|nr:response regulator [Bacteroidota bacterium]